MTQSTIASAISSSLSSAVKEGYKKEYTTLGVAAAGVYASVGDNCSVSIYDTRLDPYLGNLVEGGIVVDKRPCIHHEDFVKLVVSGPMVRESLPPKTISRLFEPNRECLDPKEAGGCDYVSMDLYLQLWEGIGARVGYRRGDYIEWNDGEKQEIPPYESRYLS